MAAPGRPSGTWPGPAKVASSWSVPVLGPGGLLGVITVFRAIPGKPRRDDLDLASLYAGYAASAIERDRLLDELTERNQLLETIREMLQTLAGPVPVESALRIALQALRRGLGADEVVLVEGEPDRTCLCRGYSSTPGRREPRPRADRPWGARRDPRRGQRGPRPGGTRTASRSPATPAREPCAREAASRPAWPETRAWPRTGTCRSRSASPDRADRAARPLAGRH